eukprot:CAMPEP_0202691414 /NCGR_PEP_ID=MMETSP1385-20130828/6139_1 /ASSEMBLY_ACC=CAM_ASM_000861 /TAXON_ID=933848 /ORGANISM="Elphidium margaritaceum" /LENGTH=465 /DNA_ID=CAMNT_0049346817 /DNA_START=26 /DNA_END=1423 /DNA_ORIENTATION=+
MAHKLCRSNKLVFQSTSLPCLSRTHRRCFASKQQKIPKSQSAMQDLRNDKTTKQYGEILEWWEKFKSSPMDLSVLDPQLRDEFIAQREHYKQSNLERIRSMHQNLSIAAQRKDEALQALPPRLAFICRVTSEPRWKSDLPKSIGEVYHNLHHTAKMEAAIMSSLRMDDAYYDVAKLRVKDDAQLKVMHRERFQFDKQYQFSSSPLPHFPPPYDPGDIRTQAAHVRSLFDYEWEPGMDIPVKAKPRTIDPDEFGEDEQVYGRDYSGVQLSKIVDVASAGGSGIGSVQKLQEQLRDEDSGLSDKEKLQKDRSKKTAEQRAKDNMRMEQVRRAKDKIKQSVKDWEQKIKKKGYQTGEGGEEEGESGGAGREDDEDEAQEATLNVNVDDYKEQKRLEAERRIEELEILGEELPSMEALLVDQALNKEFFEKKLPIILNHDLVDDEKKEQCVLLIRKYHTLQTHVGYGVR